MKYFLILFQITAFIILLLNVDSQANKDQTGSWVAVLGKNYALIPIFSIHSKILSSLWSNQDSCDTNRIYKLDIPSSFHFRDSVNDQINLSVIRKIFSNEECIANWTLLTNLSSQKGYQYKWSDTLHFIGLASSKDLIFLREQPVDTASRLFKTLSRKIVPFFDSHEKIKIKEIAASLGQENGKVKGYGFLVSDGARKNIPLMIHLSLISVQTPHLSIKVYRFDIEKKYQNLSATAAGNIDCPDISSFSGWFLPGINRPDEIINLEFVLDCCDGKESSYFIPLGYFVSMNSVYWVCQRSYYESESFEIYRIQKNRIKRVLEIFIGGS